MWGSFASVRDSEEGGRATRAPNGCSSGQRRLAELLVANVEEHTPKRELPLLAVEVQTPPVVVHAAGGPVGSVTSKSPVAVGSSSGERFCDGRQLLVETSHQFPQVDEQAPIPRVVLGPCTDIAQD